MTDTPRPTAEQSAAETFIAKCYTQARECQGGWTHMYYIRQAVATLLSDRDRLREERDAANKRFADFIEAAKEMADRSSVEPGPEKLQQVNALLTAVKENKRLREELERAKAREIVLRAEIETRRNYPAIRGSAYFPKCPEHAAGPCDCPQCKWADACRAARNATDALPSPDAGQGEMGEK